MKLNPHLFLYPSPNGFVLWDCLNHQQYHVDKPTLEALYDLSQGQEEVKDQKTLEDFKTAGICSHDSFPDFDWGWDPLSKFYHVGCSDIFDDIQKTPDEFMEEYLNVQTEDSPCDEDVECEVLFKSELDSQLLKMSFGQTLLHRKTARQFDGRSLTKDQLGALLYASCGEIHGEFQEIVDAGYTTSTRRRSYPSGGGVYPLRTLIIAINVEGIDPGVYEYHPRPNGLKKIRSIETTTVYEDLSDILCSQYFCEGIAVGVAFLPAFEKAWGKYPHSRSYRDCFLDIGHCSQSLQLTATALGLQTWMTAAFKDEKFKTYLAIENKGVYPLEFIGLGHGNGHSLPHKFEQRKKG